MTRHDVPVARTDAAETATCDEPTVAEMATTLRALWASEPEVDGDARHAVLQRLAELEHRLDRLELRSAAGDADDGSSHTAELVELSERLGALSRWWPAA